LLLGLFDGMCIDSGILEYITDKRKENDEEWIIRKGKGWMQ